MHPAQRPRLRGLCFFPALLALLSGCAMQGPRLSDLPGEQFPPRIELSSTPFFAQEQYQCGPAALATALAASGIDSTPESLVSSVYLPGRQGSLQPELIAATRARGRMPYVLAPRLEDLIAELVGGRPVLVLQNLGLKSWPVWHYAVVVGYDREREHLLLRSGTEQRQVLSIRRFERSWSLAGRWAIVLLSPGDAPARPELERFMSAAAGFEATGRINDAEAAYGRARELWPREALPWLGLANTSHVRGDLAAAQGHYVAAIERDPGNVVARNNLAETLAQRGCAGAARKEIERAVGFARGTAFERDVASTASRIATLEDRPGVDCSLSLGGAD